LTDQEFTRRMVRTVLTVAAVAGALAVLWAAREALMLVYVSALIAMGFSPLVRLIEHRREDRRRRPVPRFLAILSIYLTAVAVAVLIGLLVLPPLVEQATTLWDRLPQHLNAIERTLIRYKLMTRTVSLQEAVRNVPVGSGTDAVGTMLIALSGVMGGLLGLVTVVILSFYLLIDAESLMKYATRFVPERQRAHAATVAAGAVSKVSAWLRAQLTLAGVMGACAALGLGLLHLPYFWVVALIAAVGETIPVFGPLIAAVTAVAIALSVSPKMALAVGVFVVALHQLEANVLVPKIMERQVGVSPAAVLVALLVGASLWGLVGAILAIPTAAILSVMVEEFA
jgi:predicted PurR-regulated permease PerM